MTLEVAKVVKELAKSGDGFVDLVKHPSKITKDQALKFIKVLPVIGSIVKTAEHAGKLVDRVVHGEKEKCYRNDVLKRPMHDKDSCPSEGAVFAGFCLMPCPAGYTSEKAFFCLKTCPAEFPVQCGMMCTKNKKLCPEKSVAKQSMDAVDVLFSISMAIVNLVKDNIGKVIEYSFKLLDDFAHPNCF